VQNQICLVIFTLSYVLWLTVVVFIVHEIWKKNICCSWKQGCQLGFCLKLDFWILDIFDLMCFKTARKNQAFFSLWLFSVGKVWLMTLKKNFQSCIWQPIDTQHYKSFLTRVYDHGRCELLYCIFRVEFGSKFLPKITATVCLSNKRHKQDCTHEMSFHSWYTVYKRLKSSIENYV